MHFRSRATSGYYNRPTATGMTPTYQPISANVAKYLPPGRGVWTAIGTVFERGAGRRDEPDDVRFALNPGIRTAQRGFCRCASGSSRLHHNLPIRIVDLDLRDRHGIRAVVENGCRPCRLRQARRVRTRVPRGGAPCGLSVDAGSPRRMTPATRPGGRSGLAPSR